MKRAPRRKKLKRTPEQSKRTCIATGEACEPDQLIRFVRAPDGAIAPDFSGKLPGRGAWVRAEPSAIEHAIKRGAFSRSFKERTIAPDNLVESVATGFSRAALSTLGLARKRGDVVTGFEKTRTAVTKREASILITASDASEDGKKKIPSNLGAARRVDVFKGAELAAALGRETVVHAAIKTGASADRFLREAQRVSRFRQAVPAADL